MFERVERPPSQQDFVDINFAMVRAMKTKPARRMLAREPVSSAEKAEFDAMRTATEAQSDKKSTDMTNDTAMNDIYNSGGRVELADNDTAQRTQSTSTKRKIRKLVGMCKRDCPSNKEGMNFYHDRRSNICY